MKLWLITQSQNRQYDTYNSAVVAAGTEYQAKRIHPDGHDINWGGRQDEEWLGDWCYSSQEVTAKFIGEAKEGTEAGVILASFNAG